MQETLNIVGDVVNSGCDFLTLTMQHGSDGLKEMRKLFDTAIEQEITDFGQCMETAPQGYHGTKSRHVFAGQRKDGWLFQVSSEPAQILAEGVKQIGGAAKITRCDWQTTIRQIEGVPFDAGRIQNAIRRVEARAGRVKRIATTTVQNDVGGHSIAVGSRSSSRVLRIYDKSAEQSHRVESGLIRFEVQLRKQQASGSWKQFDQSRDQRRYSRAVVAAMMKKTGILPPFPVEGDTINLPTSYNVSDAERRRAWLLETIAPLVRQYDSDADRRAFRVAFGL